MHTTTDGKPQVGVARKIQFVNNYNDHKTIIYFFALYLFSRDGNQVNDGFFFQLCPGTVMFLVLQLVREQWD